MVEDWLIWFALVMRAMVGPQAAATLSQTLTNAASEGFSPNGEEMGMTCTCVTAGSSKEFQQPLAPSFPPLMTPGGDNSQLLEWFQGGKALPRIPGLVNGADHLVSQ